MPTGQVLHAAKQEKIKRAQEGEGLVNDSEKQRAIAKQEGQEEREGAVKEEQEKEQQQQQQQQKEELGYVTKENRMHTLKQTRQSGNTSAVAVAGVVGAAFGEQEGKAVGLLDHAASTHPQLTRVGQEEPRWVNGSKCSN
jgi:hypothetical protein